MNKGYLAELQAQPWAMEESALKAFFARLADANQGVVSDGAKVGSLVQMLWAQPYSTLPMAFFDDDEPAKKPRMSIDQAGVATIPISGVLLKAVPGWLRRWGINATGYDDIADDVRRAVADPAVRSIRLLVESPGGQVSGVKEAADAIFEARKSKRVATEVQDMCASGAYWLGSQGERIDANLNAMVGSIGVYAVYADYSELAKEAGIKVHVLASGPHKGMGVFGAKITGEQLEAQQQVIDRMASNFKADVLRGRKLPGEEKDWASGRVWLAADALSMGLIDGITRAAGAAPAPAHAGARAEEPTTEKAAAAHVGTAANIETSKEEETVMAETKPPAAAAPEVPAAPARQLASIAELKAAFPGNPDFVLAQAEKGVTLLEAKAAYGEVLEARNAKLEKENADLRAKAAPAPGAEPLRQDDPGAAARPKGDFMTLSREYAKEHKCSMREAMKAVNDANPGLHEKAQEEWAASAPRVHQFKQRIGMK